MKKLTVLLLPLLLVGLTSCGSSRHPVSVAQWCEFAEGLNDKLDALAAAEPREFEESFTVARSALHLATKIAPDEIVADIEGSSDFFDELSGALADVDFDPLAVDYTAFEDKSNDVDEAWDRIETFREHEC